MKTNTLVSDGSASAVADSIPAAERQGLNSGLFGVWAPCLTPIHADGSIDHGKLCNHINWLLANGCHGVALFGTTGEAPSFSVAERMTALEKVIESGIDTGKLMIGNGFPAVTDTITVTRHALEAGCTKVLMLPPFYFKNPSVEGLSRSYQYVLDQVNSEDIRVILYHFPRMSAVPIPHELIDALIGSHGELIAGLKDSSGKWASVEGYIQRFPRLQIFPGTDVLLLKALQIGGAGTITATADINPAGIRQVFDLWFSGENAQGAQEAAERIREVVFRYPLAAALKTVHARFSDDWTWKNVRPPLTGLSSADESELMTSLHNLNFRLAD